MIPGSFPEWMFGSRPGSQTLTAVLRGKNKTSSSIDHAGRSARAAETLSCKVGGSEGGALLCPDPEDEEAGKCGDIASRAASTRC